MLVLDTDHVSALGYGTNAGHRLRDRLLASGDDTATTIITVEEQLRGWLAEIHRLHDIKRQIPAYQRLQERIAFFARWTILPWENEAAEAFLTLRKQGVRIGSMDLKIASIALAHNCTLLTRNTSDFSHVAGLRVQNWLEP